TDDKATRFQKFIRSYNNSVSFTSLGFVIDGKSAPASRGPVFTLNGSLVHKIGAITPGVGQQPHLAQIFVVGGGGLAKAELRLKCGYSKEDGSKLYQHKYNPYAKLYQQAGNVLKTGKRVSMVFKTVEKAGLDTN
ncbi:hypothetical protein MJO28_017405, partial [Puccinia striiformis f. sp. tritici]